MCVTKTERSRGGQYKSATFLEHAHTHSTHTHAHEVEERTVCVCVCGRERLVRRKVRAHPQGERIVEGSRFDELDWQRP
jgi:hypothetical protein